MRFVKLDQFPNYEIYENGMIIRAKRLCNNGKVLSRREIKPTKNANGYRSVRLYNKNGIMKQFYLHRLVYMAFWGDIAGLEIDHLDGNRDNCALSNLSATTHINNCRNEISRERYKMANSLDKGKYDFERLRQARTKEYYENLVETYKRLMEQHGYVGTWMLMKTGHCGYPRAKRIISEMEEKYMQTIDTQNIS